MLLFQEDQSLSHFSKTKSIIPSSKILQNSIPLIESYLDSQSRLNIKWSCHSYTIPLSRKYRFPSWCTIGLPISAATKQGASCFTFNPKFNLIVPKTQPKKSEDQDDDDDDNNDFALDVEPFLSWTTTEETNDIEEFGEVPVEPKAQQMRWICFCSIPFNRRRGKTIRAQDAALTKDWYLHQARKQQHQSACFLPEVIEKLCVE